MWQAAQFYMTVHATPHDCFIQPIAWNFATSGATNLHVYNNKIIAVSDTDVSVLSFPSEW